MSSRDTRTLGGSHVSPPGEALHYQMSYQRKGIVENPGRRPQLFPRKSESSPAGDSRISRRSTLADIKTHLHSKLSQLGPTGFLKWLHSNSQRSSSARMGSITEDTVHADVKDTVVKNNELYDLTVHFGGPHRPQRAGPLLADIQEAFDTNWGELSGVATGVGRPIKTYWSGLGEDVPQVLRYMAALEETVETLKEKVESGATVEQQSVYHSKWLRGFVEHLRSLATPAQWEDLRVTGVQSPTSYDDSHGAPRDGMGSAEIGQ